MNTNKRLLMLACVAALCVRRRPSVRAQTRTATTSLEEIIVTARKRDEASLDVPVAVNVFTAADIAGGRHRAAAGLHRPDAEHDAGADAEPGHVVRHRARHLAGAQQRAFGRGAHRRRGDGESVAVQPGADRHREHPGAEGPAGRACTGATPSAARSSSRASSRPTSSRASISAGYDSGPGYRVGATVSGPISETVKYRATVSYLDTDGYIDNPFLRRGGRSVRGSVGARRCWCGSRATASARTCARTSPTSRRRRCTSTSPRA